MRDDRILHKMEVV